MFNNYISDFAGDITQSWISWYLKTDSFSNYHLHRKSHNLMWHGIKTKRYKIFLHRNRVHKKSF